jgi:hypothetical protein
LHNLQNISFGQTGNTTPPFLTPASPTLAFSTPEFPKIAFPTPAYPKPTFLFNQQNPFFLTEKIEPPIIDGCCGMENFPDVSFKKSNEKCCGKHSYNANFRKCCPNNKVKNLNELCPKVTDADDILFSYKTKDFARFKKEVENMG